MTWVDDERVLLNWQRLRIMFPHCVKKAPNESPWLLWLALKVHPVQVKLVLLLATSPTEIPFNALFSVVFAVQLIS